MTVSKTHIKILIVDDDANQRGLLAGYLEQCGYEVLTAACAEQGLEKLAAEEVKLLITDVRMPGMDGLELMRRARARDDGLPVLMVTGYADIRDAVEAMRDGALNYLEKPIDLTELGALAAEALGMENKGIAYDIGDMTLPPGVIAESPAMRDVLREAALVRLMMHV